MERSSDVFWDEKVIWQREEKASQQNEQYFLFQMNFIVLKFTDVLSWSQNTSDIETITKSSTPR